MLYWHNWPGPSTLSSSLANQTNSNPKFLLFVSFRVSNQEVISYTHVVYSLFSLHTLIFILAPLSSQNNNYAAASQAAFSYSYQICDQVLENSSRSHMKLNPVDFCMYLMIFPPMRMY